MTRTLQSPPCPAAVAADATAAAEGGASAVADADAALRRLADEIQVLVWAVDERGRITQLNRQARAYFQRPDQFSFSAWRRLMHPQDRPRVRAVLAAAMAAREDYQLRYRLMRSDGGVRWMTGVGAPCFDAQGRFCGYAGTITDVSAEHGLQEELRLREERYRSLTSLLSDCYWETDALGRFTVMEQEAGAWLGADASSLLGLRRQDIAVDPDDPGLREYQRCLDERRPFRDIRYALRPADGAEPLQISVAGEPVLREGVVTGFRGMSRNVTEQHRIEQRLKALSEENRALVDNSLDLVAAFDLEGRFLRINPAGCRITGYAAEELLGRPWQDFVHPEDREQSLAAYAGAFGQGHGELHDFENRWRTKAGAEVCLAWSAKWVAGQQVLYATARDITLRKQAEQRLRLLATCDTLTGLPNRALLYEHTDHALIQARRDGSPLAVMFMDLDRFKEVNDSLGHEAGDQLLRQVAQRLRERLRPGDLVARLGGDEFVVVLPCAHGVESAAAVARKLLAQFDEPLLLGGQEVFVGASIGIAMYPRDARTKEMLFQSADSAMYHAKTGGRSGNGGGGAFRFFAPEMHAQARQRLTLTSALRRALQRRELELHYQPRVDVATQAVVGMEALLRWNHPRLGRVPPATFIPLAEESGLINAMGAWVLRQACAQNQRWARALGRPLKMSVNLSPRQLHDPQLVAEVSQALQAADMDPALLELELTESSLMQDPQAAAQTLRQLKALGLQLAVDDFGTGHSSLSYLWRFPVDVLKLDRTFLPRLSGTAGDAGDGVTLAPAIIHLARTLHLRVVAEGVETREMLDFLREAGCDEAQGYFFCRPLPAADMEPYLHGQVAASAATRAETDETPA